MRTTQQIREAKLAKVASLGAVFQERKAKITATDYEKSRVLVEWFDVYVKRNGKPWVIPCNVSKWVFVDKSLFRPISSKCVSHGSSMGGGFVTEHWRKLGYFLGADDRKKILDGI